MQIPKAIDVFLGPAIMNDEREELAEAVYAGTTTYRLLTWKPSKVNQLRGGITETGKLSA